MEKGSLSKEELRKFGLVMALFIALIFGILMPWMLSAREISPWPWILSAIFFLLSLVYPAGLKIVHKPWMYLGHFMGIINTNIILTLIFYLVFTPVALIFKLIGKDPMERKLNSNATTSHWKSSKKRQKEHMENPY